MIAWNQTDDVLLGQLIALIVLLVAVVVFVRNEWWPFR